MLGKFLDAMGGSLAPRWAYIVLSPAFFFWICGLAAWVWNFGWKTFEDWFLRQPQPVQLGLPIAGLILVALSAILVQSVSVPVLHTLEGYWPWWMAPLKRLLVRWQAYRLERMERDF